MLFFQFINYQITLLCNLFFFFLLIPFLQNFQNYLFIQNRKTFIQMEYSDIEQVVTSNFIHILIQNYFK